MIHLISYMYAVDFQKRGLPHAHILLFLHSSSKYPRPDDINKIISMEIPTEEDDKELYHLVKTYYSWSVWFRKQVFTLHEKMKSARSTFLRSFRHQPVLNMMDILCIEEEKMVIQ